MFWHDPWILNQPLLHQFTPRIISIAESHSFIAINSYLRNGCWELPASNHVDLINVRNLVTSTQIFNNDCITWDGLTSSNVAISSIWQSFRAHAPIVPWCDIVWGFFSIPKCSFIFWLAIQDRLLTKDRMASFDMHTDLRCLLCNGGPESVFHIFSCCPYFDLIRRSSPIPFTVDWSLCQAGDFFDTNVPMQEKQIASLYVAVAIYSTWKERNYRMHNAGPGHSTLNVIFNIKQVVRERLFSCTRFKKWVKKNPSLVNLLY